MIKEEFLNEYKNQEDRIILAQILDKIKFVKSRNKIENTDFLNMYQIDLVENFLKKIKYTKYILFGGYDTAERKILILYPEKFDIKMLEKNYNKIVRTIRIELLDKKDEKLSHRNYLGGLIKLGIERDKIGDILVEENGADIVVINSVSRFLVQELPMLTRFKNSKISEKDIEQLRKVEQTTEEIKIIVPSLRLDNFVSDLARTSRNRAVEIIKNERVFVNGQNELKLSKQIKKGDTITIRGKGRFIIKDFTGTTRNGRTIVLVERFV